LTSLFAIFLLAQIGYPGQYPPDSSPGGQGPGLPFPRRSPKSSRGNSTADKKTEKEKKRLDGWITKLEAKDLEIECADHRIIVFRLTENTKKPEALSSGDYVQVEATEDDRGFFTATAVTKGQNPPVREAAARPTPAGDDSSAASAPVSSAVGKPPPAFDPEDEGPPQLKRGVPKPRKQPVAKAEEEQPELPVATARVAPPPETGLHTSMIERARAESESFLNGLPNYICQQFTTRYFSEGRPVSWKPKDVVSAEVVYEGGKERYEKLAIDGKPVKGAIEETGSWSTGEFASILSDLFSPSTHADFHFAGERSTSGQNAMVYNFEVERVYSHWHVEVAAQSVRPAYRGAVWLAKDSARVLRIEMQAVKLPEEFPNDTVETTIDYGWVNLGTDKFLLPTRAESLACFRRTSTCMRNAVEFRTYRKFSGKSNIVFQ
jgi:hypothetical protein